MHITTSKVLDYLRLVANSDFFQIFVQELSLNEP